MLKLRVYYSDNRFQQRVGQLRASTFQRAVARDDPSSTRDGTIWNVSMKTQKFQSDWNQFSIGFSLTFLWNSFDISLIILCFSMGFTLKKWIFMQTFHVVSLRVLLRWLRATARWKVEIRSCPTRCWNPLSDVYTHSYDLYCPERKIVFFWKKRHFSTLKYKKLYSILWNLTVFRRKSI